MPKLAELHFEDRVLDPNALSLAPMKIFRYFFLSVIMMVMSVCANGQMRNRLENSFLWVNVKDSTTNEPLSFASAYLIADKDTVLYKFEVTDSLGNASLRKIVPGFYSFHVEMMGYSPYTEMLDLRRPCRKNVLMVPSADYLDAAKVEAVSQGYYYKGDTLVYRTNAFPVRDGATLIELVSRLPGARVDLDGKVYINDKAVEEITVGGKTFFFDDPDRVLRTMPAKFFKQIKVFDKVRNDYSLKGEVKDKTVMDLELKEEYKKGVFGAANLSGGVAADKKSKDKFKNSVERDNGLYSGNATFAAYNKKDQITLLGDARNAVDPAAMYSHSDANAGTYRNSSVGVNFNTERIKRTDSNIELSLSDKSSDNANSSHKTAFQADADDIITTSHGNAHSDSRSVGTTFMFEKKADVREIAEFEPKTRLTGGFGYSDKKNVSTSESMYMVGDEKGNVSRSNTVSNERSKDANLNYDTKFSPFKGRLKNDKVVLSLGGSYSDNSGDRRSSSTTSYADHTTEDRDLRHDLNGHSTDLNAGAEMKHSFARGIAVIGSLYGSFNETVSDDAAFDPYTNARDEYYSSRSENTRMKFSQSLSFNYTFFKWGKRKFPMGNAPSFYAGVSVLEDKNENFTRQHGVENITGKDEWLLNVSPNARFSFIIKSIRVNLMYYGSSNTPSQALQTSNLDIADPLNVSTGNVYLRPSFNHNASLGLNFKSDRPGGKSPRVSLGLNGGTVSNPVVFASWYDDKGVSYRIPVNAKYGQKSVSTNLTVSKSVRSKKIKAYVMASYRLTYSESVSYQAKSRMAGLDKDAFDYSDMMASFWGNPNGDRFYSGQSGFATSNRKNLNSYSRIDIMCGMESWSIQEYFSAQNTRTSYSLNNANDIKVWDFSNNVALSLNLFSSIRFMTNLESVFYKGYSRVYRPCSIWNASIVRDFKKFSLSFGVSDILNKRYSIRRTETDAYIIDSQTSMVGRYAMVGVSFNFGKANARNNDKAQKAGFGFGIE